GAARVAAERRPGRPRPGGRPHPGTHPLTFVCRIPPKVPVFDAVRLQICRRMTRPTVKGCLQTTDRAFGPVAPTLFRQVDMASLRSNSTRRHGARSSRALWLLAVVVAWGLAMPATRAQIQMGASIQPVNVGATVWRGTDVGWDPVNKVYLMVSSTTTGPVAGVFINTAGAAVSNWFTIMDGSASRYGKFPRVQYAPDLNNGAGGFLVVWHHNVGVPNYVYARVLSYTAPGYFLTGETLISDGADNGSFWEIGPAVAYSDTSNVFFVAWSPADSSIHGRLVTTAGTPTGAVVPVHASVPGTGVRDPALAWNPGTNQFGLAYTGYGGSGAYAAFRLVSAAGGVSAPTSFGYGLGTFATGITVNSANQYVVAWSVAPGTRAASFSAGGALNPGSPIYVTDRFGHNQSL